MKPIIVANWKCNPITLKGAKLLLESVKKEIKGVKNVEVIICPPFPYLSIINNQLSLIKLGAQDVFWEEKGAFTGEVSPKMLKDLGCQYIIIGHSERRALGETDQMINKKIKAAIAAKLKPILCIGETEKERAQGKTFKVLKSQLEKAFYRLTTQSSLNHLVVAYEPVWAIGTGNACQPEDAKKVLLCLKKRLEKIPILYGGSVDSENALSYIRIGFQGLLVGGASLDPREFIELVKNVAPH